MKRVRANDAVSISTAGWFLLPGINGFQVMAKELYTRASDLGCSEAHCLLGGIYCEGGRYEEGQVSLRVTRPRLLQETNWQE
jgi:TPR repeat protein